MILPDPECRGRWCVPSQMSRIAVVNGLVARTARFIAHLDTRGGAIRRLGTDSSPADRVFEQRGWENCTQNAEYRWAVPMRSGVVEDHGFADIPRLANEARAVQPLRKRFTRGARPGNGESAPASLGSAQALRVLHGRLETTVFECLGNSSTTGLWNLSE